MKVGLCGLGNRLSYLACLLNQYVPEFELVCYADPAPAGLPYMRQRGVDLAGFADLNEMLAGESIDLLMIGSPNYLHLEQIRAGLETGVRIFTEKPVVTTEAQTFELLELLKQYGADQVIVGMVLRYAPLFKDLKDTVEAGQLGEITSMEASEHLPPEHGAFFMRDWRRNTGYSGGFILEKCVHDLDIYQGLLGCRPKRVVSFGGRKTFTPANKALESVSTYHKRKSLWQGSGRVFDDDTDLVDYQTVLIEYANGANLCFHSNLNVPDEFRRFCVIGSRGMAEGDFVKGFYRVHDAPSSLKLIDKTYSHDNDISWHYGSEEPMAECLARHFQEGVPLPVSILDALEAGLTAMKLDESRATGRVVDMADVWERFDSFGLR